MITNIYRLHCISICKTLKLTFLFGNVHILKHYYISQIMMGVA